MALLFRFSPKRFGFNSQYYNSYRCVSQTRKQANADPKKPNHYDVIIAGGGLVGTALACGIAKTKVLADLKVLLLEGAPPFQGFSGGQYRNRVSAINHGSVELFKSLGAWENIRTTRYKPVKQMQVWDASSDAMISFNHDNFSDDVACIIENDLILHTILEQLKLSTNVTVLNQATIDNVELRMNGSPKNIVGLKSGESMTCDLLFKSMFAPRCIRQQAESANRVDIVQHIFSVDSNNIISPGHFYP